MAPLSLFILKLSAGLLFLATFVVRQRITERGVARRFALYCRTEAPPRPEGSARDRLLGLLIAIGRPLVGRGQSALKLAADLRAIGWMERDGPAIFSGARMIGAILVAIAVGAVSGEQGLRNGTVALVAAFLLPGMALSRRGAARSRRMRAELPAAIDVLVMVLEGGAGVEQALRFSVGLGTHPAPLCQRAFRTFVQDLERGTPYELSLTRLGDRLLIDEGQLFIEVLRQALTHGTELQEPLKTLARDLRERRLADAKAAVGKATTMMTVVMVTCLLPALMTVIGAPAVSGILETLKGMAR